MKTLIKILFLSVFFTHIFTEELNPKEYVCTVRNFTTESRDDPFFIRINLKKIFVLNFKKDTIKVTQICTDCIKKKSESIYKIISENLFDIVAFELNAGEIDYSQALTFRHQEKVGTMTLMSSSYVNTWFLDCEENEDFN